MLQMPDRLPVRLLLLMASMALVVGGCSAGSGGTSSVLEAGTATPALPPTATATPTPELTPVVPTTGGTYELTVSFVQVEGACGGPASFQAGLVIEITPVPPSGSGPTPDTQGITFSQPLTGDVNTGFITPGGELDVSSEYEAYSSLLGFERDETGNPVGIMLTGDYTWQDAQGCTTRYDVMGEGAVEGQ